MEQNKETKWYAVEYDEGYWTIQDYYGVDQLSYTDPEEEDDSRVLKEQAEYNAKLCAAAPEMKELLGKLHWWLSAMLKNYPQHEAHSAYKLLEDCVELEKQLTCKHTE